MRMCVRGPECVVCASVTPLLGHFRVCSYESSAWSVRSIVRTCSILSDTIRSICADSRRPHTPQSALHTAEIVGVLQTSRSFFLEIPGVHKHVCEVSVDAQELQIRYRINLSLQQRGQTHTIF